MRSVFRIALATAMLAVLLVATVVHADDPVLASDAIVGIWETEHEEDGWSRVEIYEVDGKIHGRIVWLKNPLYDVGEVIGMDNRPRVDLNNPDPDQQSRPIMGLELMAQFVHNGKNKWEQGRIYDPKSGKTYDCKATMKDNDTLEIFGYVKVGFVKMGRNTTWKRVASAEG